MFFHVKNRRGPGLVVPLNPPMEVAILIIMSNIKLVVLEWDCFY